MAKAFNTVNHKILLKSCTNLVLEEKIHNLLKSYLSDRKQIVKINYMVSDELNVTCDVPQGTILGPVLFLLYINDMFHILLSGKLISFADDMVLIVKGKTWCKVLKCAEQKMNLIAQWLSEHFLTLNILKLPMVVMEQHNS